MHRHKTDTHVHTNTHTLTIAWVAPNTVLQGTSETHTCNIMSYICKIISPVVMADNGRLS